MYRRSFLVSSSAVCVLAQIGTAFSKNVHHQSGHRLLGEKIKRNGKHEVGKAGKHVVVADVADAKVVNMTAGDLRVRKVKSRRQMTTGLKGFSLVADRSFDIAQGEVWWYAYCFDDGLDEYCYWYPAEYVVISDGWIEYVPV